MYRVEIDAGTDDPREAVRHLIAQHQNARVESINGELVRGVCACGRPVMETTTGYAYDPEAHMYICPACTATT